MDQNNLDKLFQEQLKNLEATPNKRVWNNIESKLKKKKRTILPFWWFSGGVAAVLLLGIFLYPFSSDEKEFNKKDSEIIITESPKEKIKIENIDAIHFDSLNTPKNSKEQILVADKKTNKNEIKKQQKVNNNKELVSTKNAMKKIFLADNSIKETTTSSKKEKTIINKQNTIISDEVEKTKQEKKTFKKVDLNTFVEKKDSIIISKPLKDKWSISPVFGVLNSNSFTNTSPLDNNLSNSTNGKNTFSYGFQIGYKINKKWSIQSGIHLQEMRFANKSVHIVSSISKNSSSVSFSNGGSISFENLPAQNLDFTSVSPLNRATLNGELNQNYGYIEIPVEVKYELLNATKFNTQIVAGFSSLFLNKNQVVLNSQFITQSGKATNLNNINFSGNLGFDFNYSLNKKWTLNLNPMFKAQLKTYSEKSNGFSPFNIGIYSGVKYSF